MAPIIPPMIGKQNTTPTYKLYKIISRRTNNKHKCHLNYIMTDKTNMKDYNLPKTQQ